MKRRKQRKVRFVLANISLSRRIWKLEERTGFDWIPYFERHINRDWGDDARELGAANAKAIRKDGKVRSSYKTPHGTVVIITDVSTSQTVIVAPDDIEEM